MEQRLQTRVESGAEFASLYVNDIEAREVKQAADWLAGRRPTRRELGYARGALGFSAAVLLDRDGRLLQVAPFAPMLLGHVITERYPHLAAAVGGRTAVSNVVFSAARRVPVVAFAVPFTTKSGRRVFSGAFNVAKTPLGAYMQHLIVTPGHRVYLVDSAGALIAASGKPSSSASLRGIDPALFKLAQAHAMGSYSLPRGSQSFVTAAVAGAPWRIIVAVPQAPLYASVNGASRWLAWIAVASLLLAGLIVILLMTRLFRGRERLAALNGELDRLARIDSLTGLRNRRDIEEALAGVLSAARRRSESFAILLIDVDHFKRVNDTLGHQAGDAVLVKIAQTLSSALRVEDTIGRWGGEEFIAVLPGADAQAALTVAERIRARVEIDGAGAMTVTIGAAVWNSGGFDELISRADAALYAGKSAGRNNAQLAPSANTPAALTGRAPPVAEASAAIVARRLQV